MVPDLSGYLGRYLDVGRSQVDGLGWTVTGLAVTVGCCSHGGLSHLDGAKHLLSLSDIVFLPGVLGLRPRHVEKQLRTFITECLQANELGRQAVLDCDVCSEGSKFCLDMWPGSEVQSLGV